MFLLPVYLEGVCFDSSGNCVQRIIAQSPNQVLGERHLNWLTGEIEGVVLVV